MKLEKSSVKKHISNIVVVIFCNMFSMSISNAQEIDKNFAIFSEDIHQSMILLDQKIYQPIKGISKIWYGTLDGWSRFVNSFLMETSIDGATFFQNIPILDKKGMEIEVSDWDTADCSFSKFILTKDKSNNAIYLLVSHRKCDVFKPQFKPCNQIITGYLLNIVATATDRYPIFFKQEFSFKSQKEICTSEEVHSLLNDTVEKLNKGEKHGWSN